MTPPSDNPTREQIVRIAHAIWEAEGRPEGRDHDHWMHAKQLIADGRAEAEFPEAFTPAAAETEPSTRSVQPGFEAVPAGIVPKMKENPGPEMREEPGGRFAKQIADLPEGSSETGPAEPETPGPRNPAPIPPTNPEGFVAIPSVHSAAAGALSDDPVSPSGGAGKRKGSR